ncbi:PREDICTED: protein ROOT INITIATION DEFECTIVE 3-like [Nelumbo nucifera]|uniref:Protein ROOT INITIATION DEFECTIVE 3-like n=2 Tax=Nelumbo nucifera TaxID=4432 RepID=A0A822YEM8_NELNU|nr:PREDICTED: protein ROOT INITIATION DEFECTIVE 3-like [Nelumbo nucifera]DAD30613.1 TPA_asm: hypothetical protein HUJ06_009464 [Nelumbo nucifera]
MVREVLVACSDRSMSLGITVWDMNTGDRLLHIPTCASPFHGLLCLRNQFLVASQAHKHGSFGGGAIFLWPLNKPQSPLRSYPIEAIGPISSTKDGLYLVGGALSGNAYVWEIMSGRLLKTWRAHPKALNCLAFSGDDSLLISGSCDGVIRIWSMISLLDVTDSGSLPSFIHCWSEHHSSITGFLTTGSSSSVLVSSSMDGTCKVWDLISGRLCHTQAFPTSVTAIALDSEKQILFSGIADGRIFVNILNVGLGLENSAVISEGPSMVLRGHKGSITALTFSFSGSLLISASEDCTVCLWDVSDWVITRRFNYQKGRITNLVVIPQSSLVSVVENHQRVCYGLRVPVLDKYPQPVNSSSGTVTLLPTYCSIEDGNMTTFRSTHSLNQQILDLEQGRTPEALQMKVEMSVENRMWATRMAKHVTEMNRHLQSRLLDLVQYRLSLSSDPDFSTTERRKKLKLTVHNHLRRNN